jgi:AraC family transcriptional regulator of adaptative response/methylated-DNA-[protein]-cysteine methyltransferase
VGTTRLRVPTLTMLARLFGASATQTRRVFVRVVGMTPQQYAHAVRRRRVGQGLQEDGTVTQAIFGAGFNSSGRFYEQSEALLGMTPTQFKAGAAGQRIHYAVGTSSLGAVLVATTGRGVCAVLLGDDPRELTRDLARRFPRAELVAAGPASAALIQDVVRAVEQPGSSAALPLDIQGTAFQQRVWRALSKVPAGSRTTYTELARQIGQPTAARAVAQACAANPVAVVIPCHRVVRADGGLSGYRWGVERKRALLEREAVATAGRTRPSRDK